ncbi:MAG: hypothetical protein PHQ22_09660 [Sulfuricurvum sp.]|nr:hypothetical protein [Sulfuricurvum sp.]MDD5387445.1 hypothetical protein [Sulfuricurvum sp.]
MVGMVEITFVIMGLTTVGLSLSLLTIMKDFRALIVWSISLCIAEIALVWTAHDIKWHVITAMIFFGFVLVLILVKIKLRISAALKRIAQLEEEERQALQTPPKGDSHG